MSDAYPIACSRLRRSPRKERRGLMTGENTSQPAELNAEKEIDSEKEKIVSPASRDQGKGLLRAFSSLRHRNYRLYWSGQLISWMGTSMQTIGQAWLVLQLTHSGWQ